MKNLNYLLSGIFLFALMHVYTSITSKEEVPPNLPIHHPELDSFIHEFHELANDMFVNSKSPGAAIAIVKNGRIIYGKGFGVKKVNTNDSIDIHTTFRIASVSKTFAGVLTGKMVDKGKLSWEDNVQEYFPQFNLKNTDYAEKMQVKHILSQSTGLIQHAYTNFIEEGKDLNKMIAALSEVKLTTEPGMLYSYQNVAYGIIEPVLESAAGDDYSSLMKKEIFEPLRMKDASMDYESMLTNNNIAYPNFPRRGGWATGKISKTYYNVPSAGGINASISDMANYMIAMTGHRPEIISQKVIDDIFEPRIKTRIHWKYFSRWKDYKKSHYGLGWRIVENGESTIAYHGGYVNGFRSQLAINSDEDIGICVLTNSPTSFSSKLVPAFLKLCDEYKERLEIEENSRITVTYNP
ncbi:MAG: beta-lactamase family protein [Cyclobacteriaceae bacterium]|nr:beta-lactamase family protein [Cyclobacteriaceae bacterium]MCK5368349.1 beta-lactamase family protein [Cyclobacteriaceae bacterium]